MKLFNWIKEWFTRRFKNKEESHKVRRKADKPWRGPTLFRDDNGKRYAQYHDGSVYEIRKDGWRKVKGKGRKFL